MLEVVQSRISSSQVWADIKLWMARRRSSCEKDEEVKNSIDNSVYEFGHLYDVELINRILEDLRPRLMEDENVAIEKAQGSEIYRSLSFDLERQDWSDEILKEELTKTVESYFGADFETELAALLRYEETSEESVAAPLKWHLDTSASPNSIRLLVFMTDQEEEGGFELVGAEETESLLKEFSYEELHENPEYVRENAAVEKYNGKKGNTILTNVVDQIHRGREPSSGDSRLIMIFSFVPKWR
jgi:hypothetical protein